MGLFADRLLATVEFEGAWPPPSQVDVWREVSDYIAYREGDRARLREIAGWDPGDLRRYPIDPLPERISGAFASLIFGEAPTVTAAAEADQERLDYLVQEVNHLPAHLQRGVAVSSSEGEAWWRIFSDPLSVPGPKVTLHSRTATYPLTVAGTLVAVAFVTELESDDQSTVWRLFEVHDEGEVTNVLFRGSDGEVGQPAPLEAHPALQGVRDVWAHGLPMLAGKVINRPSARGDLGRSDYHGIEDYFLELNESIVIGGKNMRTTGLKRVVVPQAALNEAGELPMDQEVIVADAFGETLGEQTGPGPYRVLEYSFDAEALIAWQDKLAVSAITRLGIMPEFIGQGDDAANALSGTARRLRLAPTTDAGRERAQWWDQAVPRILGLLQRVDALPPDDLGYGTPWSEPAEEPQVQRGPFLTEDPAERDERHVSLRGAGLISTRTSLEERYPGREEEWYREELRMIREDAQLESGSAIVDETGATVPSGF